MSPDVLDCINAQRTGVIAVRMLDGTPHGATVHYAYKLDPLTFIILTSPTYRKLEPLRIGETPATLVIGTTEEFNKTLQMDGVAKIEDSEEIKKIYFAKFPEKVNKHPEDIFFIFRPTWWRYTDWTKPEGKLILTSELKT